MKTRCVYISYMTGMCLNFFVGYSSAAQEVIQRGVVNQQLQQGLPGPQGAMRQQIQSQRGAGIQPVVVVQQIQNQPQLHETISIFNATQFRVIVRYIDNKDVTRIEPIDIGASTAIDHRVGSPITYSVGDITDRIFPATPDMFSGAVLTLKVPPAIQDLLTRSTIANVTSVAQTVANQSIPQRPPASAPPVPTGVNAHPPLVVPLSSPETIHYTLPGLGAPVR